MLIDAGVNPGMTESSGINLLHWAVIANRPQIVPILASAGVNVNAQDEHGFTPVMYAATIDFGDTTVLRAILKAGADPAIRNEDGRTAIEQTRHFRHVNLETVLRNWKR
jgi:ankyrin repeat protein